MRVLAALSLSVLWFGIGEHTACAQSSIQDMPPAFFGAQRGRVVMRQNGTVRMRYGRGLTPQGAEVISTAIGTLGPLLPQIINPVAVPMAMPVPYGAAPGYGVPGPEPECGPLLPDDVLDPLADSSDHAARLAKLDAMSDRVSELVEAFGKEPAVPTTRPSSDEDVAPVVPRPGGRINPQNANRPIPAVSSTGEIPPAPARPCGDR